MQIEAHFAYWIHRPEEFVPRTIRRLILAVSDETGISVSLIKGTNRAPRTVTARDIVVWLSDEVLGRTNKDLARSLDRDLSTIAYARKRAAGRYTRDAYFKGLCDRVLESVR